MSLAQRTLVAALLVATITVSTAAVRRAGWPRNVTMPAWNLEDLPLRLGEWSGKTVPLDPQVFRAIGADVVVDRLYSDPASRQVSCHTAIFTRYEVFLPHGPRECYTGSGYRVLAESPVVFDTPGGSTVHAGLLEIVRDDMPAYVLFWYQLGENTCWDQAGVKPSFRALRGSEQWPALSKVMLQSSASNAKEAKAAMIDLGGRVFDWMNRPDPAAEGSQHAAAE